MDKILAILILATVPAAEANLGSSLETPSVFVWGSSHSTWDRVVVETVREEFDKLNEAKDVEEFCPGYARASQAQKESCWQRLISALVYKENDEFNPREVFVEPAGAPSVGLMMLSRGECRNAPTDEALKNPVENLRCGIKRMAKLIARGDCISCRRGAAAYWSTLRTPYKAYGYNLGKKAEIVAMTTNYKSFSSPAHSFPAPMPLPRPEKQDPVTTTANAESSANSPTPMDDNFFIIQNGFFGF